MATIWSSVYQINNQRSLKETYVLVSQNAKLTYLFNPFRLKELKLCRQWMSWHSTEGEKLHLFFFIKEALLSELEGRTFR